jgi:WD40 repeat protein
MRCPPGWLLAAFILLTPVPAPADSPRTDLYGDSLPAGAVARLGSVRYFHPGGIAGFAFAPDGKHMLVVGHADGGLSVRTWDTFTGREMSKFPVKKHDLCVTEVTPDGKHVLLGRGYSVALYDRTTGKLVRTFEAAHAFWHFALSPDGKWLAAQPNEWKADAPIRLWDVATGKELPPLPGRGMSGRLRFSADGKWLLSASVVPTLTGNSGGYGSDNPQVVCVWDLAGRKILQEIAVERWDMQVEFSPDGQCAAVADRPANVIRIVTLATGEQRCKIAAPNLYFQFGPDGKTLATMGHDQVPCLWDAATGQQIRRFNGILKESARLSGFSPDGKLLAIIVGGWDSNGRVVLYDVATGEPLPRPPGHESAVNCLAFAQGAKLLASGSADCSVRLWDPANGKHIRRLDGHQDVVTAVAFAPDGKVLASSGVDCTTRLWRVADGKEIARFDGPEDGAAALRFTPDGATLLAGGRAARVHAWELAGDKRAFTFRTGPDGQVFALSPCGRFAVSANGEIRDDLVKPRLRLWDTAKGKPLLDLSLSVDPDVPSGGNVGDKVVLSADGRLLASSEMFAVHGLRTVYGGATLRVWERATGQPILHIAGSRSRALALSPDGRLLAAGNGTAAGVGRTPGLHIDLWHTATGKRVRTLKGHTAELRDLAFSPDGKTLASASGDHSILIWDDIQAPPQQPGKAKPTDKQLQVWWDDLTGTASVAHQAREQLLTHPAEAVAWIGEKLKPVPAVDAKGVEASIADLESNRFAERHKASQNLEQLAELAEPAIRQALAKNPPVETTRRLELLLVKVEQTATGPEALRTLRAVPVLEGIGSAEAVAVLRALAGGAPQARQTQEAQAALERLGGGL